MKIKKNDILFVLLLGTIWGVSEAILGGALYRFGLARRSALLTVIAFAVLTLAREYRPRVGIGTLLGLVAVLYRGLGIFVMQRGSLCHLSGIFLLGVSYDLMRLVWRDKRDSLFAASAAYVGYALFAVTITYVFQQPRWHAAGISKMLDHVLITGTIAAIGAAVVVPVTTSLARGLKVRRLWHFALRWRLATPIISLLVVGLWILCLSVSL